jgi:hypothetical protein
LLVKADMWVVKRAG